MAAKNCTCCKLERENRNEPPRRLATLSVRTERKKHPVFACVHCDGPIVELSKRPQKDNGFNFEASTRPEDPASA